jgi:DNA-binding LytR/AlgR family response regulator
MKTYQAKGNNALLIINHKTSQKVLIKNVVLLKGNINYTTLYLQNGKTKTLSHTLKFYETFLRTHGFLRVHRAFMINPNHVQEYCEEQEIVTMTSGHQANISRRRKHELKVL